MKIVHIDINGPFSPTICDNKSFITFIDVFSRYGYLYLMKQKSEALEKFKIFKTEIEKQLGKVIKVVGYDHGGKYYGKYDSTGQHMGPFAKYLQDYGIVPQYTMSDTPEQNGVVERQTHTLKYMMRSITSRCNLP